jgi:hypothetical protein
MFALIYPSSSKVPAKMAFSTRLALRSLNKRKPHAARSAFSIIPLTFTLRPLNRYEIAFEVLGPLGGACHVIEYALDGRPPSYGHG